MKKFILSFFLLFGVVGAAYWGCCGLNLAPQSNEMADNTQTKTITTADADNGRPATQWFFDLMKDPETNKIDHEALLKGQQQALKMSKQAQSTKALDVPIQWEELGPNNVGGRTRAMLVDRNNDQHMYAGGVSGGMFRSLDGGENWEFMINSVNKQCTYVSTITQTEDGTIYIGTGNSFDSFDNSGSGIFTTTDGVDYQQIASTNPENEFAWRYVNMLVNQVIDGKTYLYAATAGRLFISDNGGTSWDIAEGVPSGRANDVQIGADGAVYAFVDNGLYKSTNGKDNFTRIDASGGANGALPTPAGERKVIATSPTDPNFVYVITIGGSCLDNVWQSKDGGDTFTSIGSKSAVFDPCALSDGSCQCNYDLALTVSPSNPSRIYFGGISLWTWGEETGWAQIDKYFGFTATDPNYVHADKHSVYFHPNNPDVMYCTNDGGIFRTENVNATYPEFKAINKGYNVVQFYGIGANHKGQVIGGSQDNGTQFLNYGFNSTQSSLDAGGGDGGYTELSNIDENIAFTSIYGAQTYRITGGPGNSNGSCIFTCPCDPDSPPPPDPCNKWAPYCPNVSEACTIGTPGGAGIGSESFFIHPYYLWEDTRLYYEVAKWKLQGDPPVGNPDIGALTGWNGQQFIFTTDAEKYIPTVENPYDVDENSQLYVGYDLETDQVILNPNDDKFRRARLFMGTATSQSKLWMSEDAIKPGKSMEWVDLTHEDILGTDNHVRPLGGGTAVGFSEDGDMVVLGTTNGRLLRVTGLNSKNYEAKVLSGTSINGYISSISVNPKDPANVLVTVSSTGGNNVYISDNFLAANPDFESITGSGSTALPSVPVFSGVILDGFDTFAGQIDGDLLVGTLTGVYYGERTGNTVVWEEQNLGLGQVPVYTVRQEPMANYEEDKYYFVKVTYVGTYGRGAFRTTTLTAEKFAGQDVPPSVYSIPDFDNITGVESATPTFNGLSLFPNPASTTVQLEIQLEEATSLQINVYDLSGKMVKQATTGRLPVGTYNHPIDVSDLNSGNYIVTAESGTQRMSKQLVVSH